MKWILRQIVSCVFVLVLLDSKGLAQLHGDWPSDGGPITVCTTAGPIESSGLDFQSNGPFLSNGSNTSPFDSYVTGNDQTYVTRVTIGSQNPVTIDGCLELDVSVSAEGTDDDISATWRNADVPTSFTLGDLGSTEVFPEVSGTFPVGGGPITITTEEPLDSSRVLFSASRNLLTIGEDPSPFERFRELTADKYVVLDNVSGESVMLDGSVTFDVLVGSDASSDEIRGRLYQSFSDPVRFPITPVPEPGGQNLALLGALVTSGLIRGPRKGSRSPRSLSMVFAKHGNPNN